MKAYTRILRRHTSLADEEPVCSKSFRIYNFRFQTYCLFLYIAYSYKQSDSTIVNYYLGDGISAMGTITLQF